MIIKNLNIADLLIIEPNVFKDERGFFFESYKKSIYNDAGILYDFIQDNQSFSTKGVIRGLHLQINPFAQAKLVRVLEGEILDVAVDLRAKSSTYGQHFSVILSAENRKQLMIPPGFAHGFSVLSATTSVMYKVDQLYDKDSERGIRYDDPTLAIDWQINLEDLIVSEKDLVLPNFDQIDWEF
ncbi:dTDP-4-dehydrorhamnose 3,5-epimerase [Flavobacterium sp. PL12]|uniref:dTDP-4-dehydrorhamnose 3,5-epimerase n=1 Tax=Flavobacterium sp. PL12 TaxID=3071718 RepID=UPI00319E6687